MGSSRPAPDRETVRAAFEGRRVLVAGATGFVGRAVARALTEARARLRLPAREPAAARSLFAALGISGKIVSWEATDEGSVRQLVEEFRPHVVFNLVGYGVDPRERDPGLAEAINARLPERLVEAVARARAPSWPGTALVHAGTALEYGEVGGDLHEAAGAPPTTEYGRTKLEGTRRLAAGAERHAVPSVTARLFTVYGPGERPGRLVPALLRTARTGESLALTEGLQSRDFTYVDDVAEGLLRLASTPLRPGDLVNLATGRLLTVRELVRIAAEVLEIPGELLRFGELPERPEEMRHGDVSVDRLVERTGWRPGTSPARGIAETARRERERPAPHTT